MMMKRKLDRLVVAAMMLSAVTANAQSPQPSSPSGRKIEAAMFFGVVVAGKDVSRGVNATGGEQLIARLGHSGAVGVRAGLHNELLGLEGNLLTSSGRPSVKNEFGVEFPNHAESPLLYSADVLLYPFRSAIRSGSVRPYLISGVGGLFLSADLDNIQDKETHGALLWNAGGGVKVFVDEGSRLYVDLRFTNHRLLRPRGADSIDLRSVSVGVGARF